jgi:hypothetical protein
MRYVARKHNEQRDTVVGARGSTVLHNTRATASGPAHSDSSIRSNSGRALGGSDDEPLPGGANLRRALAVMHLLKAWR